MCKCNSKCNCNITSTTKGEKGDASPVASLGYKEYVAILEQSGTGDPVATVLVNTLGGVPVWTRVNEGYYYGTLANAFPFAKTHITPPASYSTQGISPGYGNFDCYSVGLDSTSDVFLATAHVTSNDNKIFRTDGLLYGANGASIIRIVVYS